MDRPNKVNGMVRPKKETIQSKSRTKIGMTTIPIIPSVRTIPLTRTIPNCCIVVSILAQGLEDSDMEKNYIAVFVSVSFFQSIVNKNHIMHYVLYVHVCLVQVYGLNWQYGLLAIKLKVFRKLQLMDALGAIEVKDLIDLNEEYRSTVVIFQSNYFFFFRNTH